MDKTAALLQRATQHVPSASAMPAQAREAALSAGATLQRSGVTHNTPANSGAVSASTSATPNRPVEGNDQQTRGLSRGR